MLSRALCSLLTLSLVACGAQQRPDTAFSYSSGHPTYGKGQGPVVVLDEAHNNFHTLGERYYAFGKVVEADGYVLQPGTEPFSRIALDLVRILVISNALATGDEWALPTRSAFTPQEIEIVRQWVSDGGNLFLIADHMPFGGAAAEMGRSFGFNWVNGYAMRKTRGPEIFSRVSQNLTANAITEGGEKDERIDSIALFTGSAFFAPPSAVPITLLNDDYEILLPQHGGEFKETTASIDGRYLINGAMLEFGRGRIVAFGEAAMFSAQLIGRDDEPMGMKQRGAEQNPQFLLNVIHWLDRRL